MPFGISPVFRRNDVPDMPQPIGKTLWRAGRIQDRPRYVTGDMIAMPLAAVAGVGVCQLPVMRVGTGSLARTLVPLLPAWRPRKKIIHAVLPSCKGLLPARQMRIDHLADRFVAFEEEYPNKRARSLSAAFDCTVAARFSMLRTNRRNSESKHMQLRTEEIESYLLVVELGSVSGAARHMALSKSVVSKRISDLERSLGVTLLQRSTRRVQPTESGRHFYEQARAAMAQLTNAAESISKTSQELCGELRILAPMSFGTLWLSPLISEFAKAHPRLHVVMELDDRLVDTGYERYDVAIRITRLGDSALIARKLAVSRRILCCSPEYAAHAGLPESIDDIAGHACLSYSNSRPGQIWAFRGHTPQAAPKIIAPRGVFTANNGEVLRDAALGDHGIAVLPLFIVSRELAAGRLIEVLPDEAPIDDGVFAVYPRTAYTSQKIRTLIQFLQQSLSPPPWEPRCESAVGTLDVKPVLSV